MKPICPLEVMHLVPVPVPTSVRLQTICMVQIVHKSRDSPEVSVTAVAPAAAEHVLIASGRVLNTPRPVPAVFLAKKQIIS